MPAGLSLPRSLDDHLEGSHRIGAGGKRRAGHDPLRGSSGERDAGLTASRDLAGQPELAGRIGRPHREAVHRAVGERRHVDGCRDRLVGEDAAQRDLKRNELDIGLAGEGQDAAKGLLEGEHRLRRLRRRAGADSR